MNDQVLNIKLVEEVEKHEVLYNYYLPAYSRKDISEKAWGKVAAKVNMTATECKDRWRNLRTVFIRKMKPLPNGTRRHRRAYYLADAMQFCVPFIKALAPVSSEYPPVIQNREITDDLLEVSLKCEDSEVSPGDSSEIAQISQAPQSRSCSPQASPERYTPPQESLPEPSSIRANKTNYCESDAGKCVNDYLKSKKARLEATASEVGTRPSDVDRKVALEMFLLSLLPELEELNDSQIKLFKRRIFSVIDEISASPQYHHSQLAIKLSPQSDHDL